MRRDCARALGVAALAAALAAAAGCQDVGDGGGAKAAKCGGKIAMFGAYTGDNAGLQLPALNAAKLAVKKHNEANPTCKIELQAFDTQGDSAQASPIASRIAGDPSYLGVIGGGFSGETDATMKVFEGGGLAMISHSATRMDLTQKGNKVFHRVVGHDGVQAKAVASYLKAQNAQKVFLIDDGAAYGAGITAQLRENLGNVVVGTDKVQEKQSQFDATISKIRAAGADYVLYGGYTREAAPLVRQMRAGRITAKFIGPDGVYDAAFAEGAAGSAEGAIVTCPCLPPNKAGGTFAADYQREYNEPPGNYSAEGYDAAQVFIDAIEAGKSTREDVLAFVNAYDKQGVSKYIKFDSNGDVDSSRVVVWAYEVKGNELVPFQELKLS